MVSRFESGDTSANGIDDADALMPEDSTGRTARHITLQNMQVRAADGCFHHFDNGISRGLYFRLGTIFERFVPGSMVDKRFHGMVRSNR